MNNNISKIIGKRISKLRKEKGISLSKLAELAKISKSTLSSIESGNANPTISTLWAIGDALNVPFGELLPKEFNEVDESGITVKLIEQSENKKIEVYLMKLKANSVREAKPHKKGVIERVLVVKGEMIVGSKSSPKHLKVGEEIEFCGDVPHIYKALNKEVSAVVVIIYSPTEIVKIKSLF
ncbi:helix-turn-helix domain-containing protein [Methanotorris formicicus]|nr:helix-turn-helix transcriptional regulator [Methanotorris formicicus]